MNYGPKQTTQNERSKTVKHLAWDEGIINKVMREVLGSSYQNKTTKTYCEKRVSFSKIDNEDYDCPQCKLRKNAEV
jgi:hypothetical protein